MTTMPGAIVEEQLLVPLSARRVFTLRSAPVQKMNLAAFLIPSSLDAKQALRLRRFGLAALTYAASAGFVAVGLGVRVLPALGGLAVGLGFFLSNFEVLVGVLSGFFLRFTG